ncbi:MAG: hypothetical protein EZS28_003167 [Streblomastix strix]|uniref:Uncharacterized protein n=1 Tax=Streblomastix strix TaxID=222440 RepID=A0A5J4X1T1_9EUKA|nr:MAG: hypothetical protein EZS28_003167 [Streblomastix strix]
MLLYDVAEVHFFFCVFQVSCVSFADVVVFMGKVLLDTIIGRCDLEFSDEFEKSFEFADVCVYCGVCLEDQCRCCDECDSSDSNPVLIVGV